ncbi:4410_t:CDS:1, partial [Acaulospora colombiana]
TKLCSGLEGRNLLGTSEDRLAGGVSIEEEPDDLGVDDQRELTEYTREALLHISQWA